MLASRGMHHAFRILGQVSKGQFGHPPSSRGIHVLKARPTAPSSRTVLGRAQDVLIKFLYGNNGYSASKAASFSSRAANQITPIRNQLSFPARQFLARNAGPPFLPRPPHMNMPRSVAQVGLGTARNFSSARPIFQSLAENVPIATRALYEMDLDVDKKKKRALRRNLKENGKKEKKTMKMVKDTSAFDDYFATLPPAEVSTQLIVPLAPVESQVDSVSVASDGISLLNGSALLATHNAHSTHALRISSLFLRLDQGKVWDKGAHYEAFGVEDQWPDGSSAASSRALCTSLRIVFDGWTENQVRGVIGDAGQGWCVIREVRKTAGAPESVDTTRCTTPASAFDFDFVLGETSGTEQEFVMPQLDFSMSSTPPPSGMRTPFEDMAPLHESSAWSSPMLGSFSDVESVSELSDLGEDALRWAEQRTNVTDTDFHAMSRGQEIMMPF